jgi:hypothetical protein
MAKSFPNTGATVVLAADRTALTSPFAGMQFFETDTKFVYTYDGSAWHKTNYVGISPAFHVIKTNAAAVTSGSIIVWNSVKLDTTSSYSISTGRFTAPVAGTYIISVWGMAALSSPYFILDLYKNGALYMRAYTEVGPVTNTYYHVSMSAPIPMAVGDYLHVQPTGGSMYGLSGYNGFTGYFLD